MDPISSRKMDDQHFADFVGALGEEMAVALDGVVSWERMPPSEGYSVYCRAFADDPTPQKLAAFGDEDLEILRAACEAHFEQRGIELAHIRVWISRTLSRWPA